MPAVDFRFSFFLLDEAAFVGALAPPVASVAFSSASFPGPSSWGGAGVSSAEALTGGTVASEVAEQVPR